MSSQALEAFLPLREIYLQMALLSVFLHGKQLFTTILGS
jgi:hypothetical protein